MKKKKEKQRKGNETKSWSFISFPNVQNVIKTVWENL